MLVVRKGRVAAWPLLGGESGMTTAWEEENLLRVITLPWLPDCCRPRGMQADFVRLVVVACPID